MKRLITWSGEGMRVGGAGVRIPPQGGEGTALEPGTPGYESPGLPQGSCSGVGLFPPP